MAELRPATEADLDLMRAWRNHPDVRRRMYTQHEITAEEHWAWWASQSKRDDVVHLICENDGVALGVVSFYDIDHRNRKAEWAFYAALPAPKGTGTMMETAALAYAFGPLHLNKLCCEVLESNSAVIRLHQRFGFQLEGHLRAHVQIDGKYEDVARLGLTKADYTAFLEQPTAPALSTRGNTPDMSPEITIANRKIGTAHPPYVIAELSANHNGSLDAALAIIDKAAAAGVDAVKLQTYRADTITLDSERPEFQITEGKWAGQSLYQLYQIAHTPWEWHKPLFDHAKARGITIFSSPFDFTAVDLLEDLNAPAYKIASFEAVDLPLIRYVAQTGKPMIISTGMADLEEIAEAIDAARSAGCRELAILHCVSGYPAPAEDYNLRTIPDMIARFGVPTGLSDHTLDNTTAVASVALGVSIIEKHMTLDRNGGGPDDSFSLEPAEFEALNRDAKTTWRALGEVNYGIKSSERSNVMFRRSLYFVRDVKAGHVITAEDVRSVRPGHGAAPKHYDRVIGSRARVDIKAQSPVRSDDLEG